MNNRNASIDNSTLTFTRIEHKSWPQIKSIYLEGIATGQATFQQAAPEIEEWDKSMKKMGFEFWVSGTDWPNE